MPTRCESHSSAGSIPVSGGSASQYRIYSAKRRTSVPAVAASQKFDSIISCPLVVFVQGSAWHRQEVNALFFPHNTMAKSATPLFAPVIQQGPAFLLSGQLTRSDAAALLQSWLSALPDPHWMPIRFCCNRNRWSPLSRPLHGRPPVSPPYS